MYEQYYEGLQNKLCVKSEGIMKEWGQREREHEEREKSIKEVEEFGLLAQRNNPDRVN